MLRSVQDEKSATVAPRRAGARIDVKIDLRTR